MRCNLLSIGSLVRYRVDPVTRRSISPALQLCFFGSFWLLACSSALLPAVEGVEIVTVDKRYYLGVILSEDAENIVVRDAQGIKSQIAKKSIAERIALQDPNDRRRELEAIFDARLAAIDPPEAAAFYELGLWAKQRGMKKQATQAFREVLRVEPGHNGAGAELGWKRVDGHFVDPAATVPVPAADPIDLIRLLNDFDPEAVDGSETAGAGENAAVSLVKNNPALRGDLYKIVKNPPNGDKAREIRRKAILLVGRSRRFDMIATLLEILLTDTDSPTVEATAKALRWMKYDRMAQVLADLAALNKVRFYRERATFGLAVVADSAGIDRLLFHAGFQVAGGQTNDQHNPLIEVGGSQLNAMEFLQSRAPQTGRENTADQTPLYPALTALRAVSGKDFKTNLSDWRLWWAGAKAEFQYRIPSIPN